MKFTLFIILIVLWMTPSLSSAAESGEFSLTGEISSGVSRLAHESADLVRTPLQTDNGALFITLGVAGGIGLTSAFDKDIYNKLQTIRSSSLDKATNAGSLAGNPVYQLGFATLLYGGAIAADSPKWKEAGEMIGESLALADASTLFMKEVAGRGRPYATHSDGDFKPMQFKNNYDSFPSMHTASSFALASVMASMSGTFVQKATYYTAATFVGFSRLYQNQHWASDVLLGAAVGELCGRVVTSYHTSGQHVAFIPQFYDKGAGVAMVGKW